MRVFGVLLCCLATTGCSLTPVADGPAVRIPEHYAEAGDWMLAAPADETPKGVWWQAFGDPVLNELQASLPKVNPTLGIALARLEQAQALSQSASAGFWPKVGLGVSHSKVKTSSDASNYSSNRVNPAEDFVASATLSYELDLFGRIRASAASARAQSLAAASDVLAIELGLRAELTNDYFALRALDAQLEVLENTLETDQQALNVTERLSSAGVATASEVALSKAQLETVRSQLSDTRIRRAQAEHAIALLLGKTPTEWQLPSQPLIRTMTAPDVTPGLPSSLLQRRPDIAAAQRRVESARAQVGLARSANFPIFSLGAVAGQDSTRSSHWFEAPARFWSITPAAMVTLLDGGQRRAQTRSALGSLQEATETYRRSVLTAFVEVDDQLAAIRELRDAHQSAARNVEASLAALHQSQNRLEAGATTYLELASAQNALLNARLLEISILQRQISATTLLIRALGGSWSN